MFNSNIFKIENFKHFKLGFCSNVLLSTPLLGFSFNEFLFFVLNQILFKCWHFSDLQSLKNLKIVDTFATNIKCSDMNRYLHNLM